MTGILDSRAGSALSETVERMTSRLRHRGPDDFDTWVDLSAGIALGHRRLSILDLSDRGHQPMISASGRYVLSYNGEIYNHRTLRRQLESGGSRFRGHSDTEVLLEAIDRWGLLRSLTSANGMFALALWDRDQRRLWLARDRLGEKPMYYGWAASAFIFGSELKALRSHPEFSNELNTAAVAVYLSRNCVPAPLSIFDTVRKLPPGSVISLRHGASPGTYPAPSQYWSLEEVAQRGLDGRVVSSSEETVEALHALLLDSVKLRMEADVPLGAFLSGGIDSSTIVALMQAQSQTKVRTFTIGFNEAEYDEAADARGVADYLGTDHLELRVRPHDVLNVIPRLPEIYDEPFSDSSQIPTYLISRLTREHVTVSLSGDGGDEAFGGYNRYLWCPQVLRATRRIPRSLRPAVARSIAAIPPRSTDQLYARLHPLLPARLRVRMPATKLQKVGQVLTACDLHDMYVTLTSRWPGPLPLAQQPDPVSLWECTRERGIPSHTVEGMMFQDAVTYLPDDILTKLDRATMACSLEARVPFLDHRLLEFLWSIPLEMKINASESKWLLREVLYEYVPRNIVERPKMGFGLPIGDWLRGPLRPWAEELLLPRNISAQGIVDPAPVRRMWEKHLAGRRDFGHQLWSILMLQAWLLFG